MIVTFSPHAWGWSAIEHGRPAAPAVLPTRVGMVRQLGGRDPTTDSSPHTRGDGPPGADSCASALLFSPHAWAWSDISLRLIIQRPVLPTRVGMVRYWALGW